jgi:aryl-alcohol dehydrogenase-like predicted oxidoreductase
MQTVRVGNTSVQVSRLCFGTMQLGPLLRRLPLMQGADLLLYAFDCGITTFDTAKEYRTRDYLAVAFSDNPQVVVIDKSSARSYEGMEREVAESLIDLNREEADLFLLNDVRSRQDFAMRQGAWRYLCEAKAMGLVKAIGLSTHTVEGALLAAELQEADFVQVAFNVIGAGILDGDLAAMEGALQRLKDAGKTVCAIKPLAGGMLSRDRWKEALEFVFTHPCVDCVCMGLLTREEIDAACAFANGEPVHEVTATTIAQTPRKLVILDWCTGCEACIPVCPTQALYMKDGMARVIQERCDWCGKCGPVCPDEAIFLLANPIAPKEEAE